MMNRPSTDVVFRAAAAAWIFSIAALSTIAADAPPVPSGHQVDGAFHKVILDADKAREAGGPIEDTVIDPMELSVAKDGRVFWAERAGVVKMWSPESKKTTTIASLPVFSGLEDGLLGMTLDPKFLENHWVYLNRSLPDTQSGTDGKKSGIIRVFLGKFDGFAI